MTWAAALLEGFADSRIPDIVPIKVSRYVYEYTTFIDGIKFTLYGEMHAAGELTVYFIRFDDEGFPVHHRVKTKYSVVAELYRQTIGFIFNTLRLEPSVSLLIFTSAGVDRSRENFYKRLSMYIANRLGWTRRIQPYASGVGFYISKEER